MNTNRLLAPVVLAWAIAFPSALAAAGECPQLVAEDPAFAGIVAIAIAQGPAITGPAGNADCRPGTTLKVQASGEHGLAVSLFLDNLVAGKRQLDFATEPKPFDAAEAVALAYREMAANLARPRPSASPPLSLGPARTPRATSAGGPKRRASNAKEETATNADDQVEEGPPTPPASPPPITVPPPSMPQPIQPPPAPAETHSWSLSLAATWLLPEFGPARMGPTIDLGRDMGRWWVAHVTARLAPFRVGTKRQANRGDSRQFSFVFGTGPQLVLGELRAALLAGVGPFIATSGSTDITTGVFGDLDLAYDASRRLRIGARAGLGIAPRRLREPCTGERPVPASVIHTSFSLGWRF